VGLLIAFTGQSDSFQLAESGGAWIPGTDITYRVGVDGISIWMVLLTTFLSVIAVLGSWTGITTKVRTFHFCLLLLETGMLGVFAATDLFLFYVFWEAMLIPMYLIIGVWGGERRVYAAVKFVLYTLVGGVLMLVGILMLYYALPAGQRTFDIARLLEVAPGLPPSLQVTLFCLFGVAFAIKVPLFPFHTWLPDAHVEAPTSGSVILAGVLLKMGAYGFLRMCVGFFPAATEALAPAMMWLGVTGVLYGGAAAMWQPDIKRLIAYSSVSHLGFVILGIFALNTTGIQGAVLQMVNHGLSTGALFLMVGMIYERRHTRRIDDYRGLWEEMPLYSRIFLVVALSSIGLPGLNGFIGELLALAGTFTSHHELAMLWTALAALGVVVAACYMLWMYRRVFYGSPDTRRKGYPVADMRPLEVVPSVMLLAGIVWLGVFPTPLLSRVKASADAVVRRYEIHTGAGVAPDLGVGALREQGPETVPLDTSPDESGGGVAQ
jgi:NADH-quinone oxidoreductase subunit M